MCLTGMNFPAVWCCVGWKLWGEKFVYRFPKYSAQYTPTKNWKSAHLTLNQDLHSAVQINLLAK